MGLSLRPVKTDTELKTIQMSDLASQYQSIREEIDRAIGEVLSSANYINGPQVRVFASELETFMGVKHVIPCANGTDALQIALMALNLPQGSEIITAGFSYAAVAEVCGLLGFKVVYCDVDPDTFNIDAAKIEALVTDNTKAIIPVHLFGQCADMKTIMAIADKFGIKVIEDNAQSIGAVCNTIDGQKMSGTIGHLSTLSFFPSKNLGCYGDGGAICTNDDKLAEKAKMIANHGQSVKYKHDVLGLNSRLDTIQAAILSVKLKHLDRFNSERLHVASQYDNALSNVEGIRIPSRSPYSSHVFHQYTLKLETMDVETFKGKMKEKGIPTMVYYPMPLYRQNAYSQPIELPNCETLCKSVISLPIGTDMNEEQIDYITSTILEIITQK